MQPDQKHFYYKLNNPSNAIATSCCPFNAALFAGTLCVEPAEQNPRMEIVTLELKSDSSFILHTVSSEGHLQLAEGFLNVQGDQLHFKGNDHCGAPMIGIGQLKDTSGSLKISFERFLDGMAHGILYR